MLGARFGGFMLQSNIAPRAQREFNGHSMRHQL